MSYDKYRPWGYKTFSRLNSESQLGMKFILLINVGILTFISMINTTFDKLKAKNFLIEISCSVELSMLFYITLGPCN